MECEGPSLLSPGAACVGLRGGSPLIALSQMMLLSLPIKALEPVSGAWSTRREGGGPLPHNELIVWEEVIKKL